MRRSYLGSKLGSVWKLVNLYIYLYAGLHSTGAGSGDDSNDDANADSNVFFKFWSVRVDGHHDIYIDTVGVFPSFLSSRPLSLDSRQASCSSSFALLFYHLRCFFRLVSPPVRLTAYPFLNCIFPYLYLISADAFFFVGAVTGRHIKEEEEREGGEGCWWISFWEFTAATIADVDACNGRDSSLSIYPPIHSFLSLSLSFLHRFKTLVSRFLFHVLEYVSRGNGLICRLPRLQLPSL